MCSAMENKYDYPHLTDGKTKVLTEHSGLSKVNSTAGEQMTSLPDYCVGTGELEVKGCSPEPLGFALLKMFNIPEKLAQGACGRWMVCIMPGPLGNTLFINSDKLGFLQV